MDEDQVTIGTPKGRYTKTGNLTGYEIEIEHDGLNEYKIISAKDEDILNNKINAQIKKWDIKWKTILDKKKIFEEKETNIETARLKTEEAIKSLKEVDDLLIHTLSIDDSVNWENLKDTSKFKKSNCKKVDRVYCSKNGKPNKMDSHQIPSTPDKGAEEFKLTLSFFDNLFKSRKIKKENEIEEKFQKAIDSWEIKKKEIETENEKLNKTFNSQLEEWNNEKSAFEKKQSETNSKIDILKENYLKKDPQAIVENCDLVLNNSQYPETFPQSFEIEYNEQSKILVVEYSLPPIEKIPTLNEVKFISAKNELKEYHISQPKLLKLFDSAMYKITLRTIHELFEADVAEAIDAISFNGWINSINNATGKRENTCILSLQVKKEEFLDIDLKHVDPKACFKNFKGLGSSKLSGITPVQPILQIDRTDKRFTSSYAVAENIDNSTNLAAMGWEDFEHLIREVFAKEFSSNGGEVKVTQASSDGGVDAIAFDPDPIRGGKIVIQAKRYTNTVGVAAIRDLYGTVMNEGATKGILVTTTDYGPDAYEFVKDKPLTLLNGANLLHLLEKHGHEAKIDIKEAKKILADQ